MKILTSITKSLSFIAYAHILYPTFLFSSKNYKGLHVITKKIPLQLLLMICSFVVSMCALQGMNQKEIISNSTEQTILLANDRIKNSIKRSFAKFVNCYNNEPNCPNNLNKARNVLAKEIASIKAMTPFLSMHIFFMTIMAIFIEGYVTTEEKKGEFLFINQKMFNYLLTSHDVLWAICIDKILYCMFFLRSKIENVLTLLTQHKNIREFLDIKAYLNQKNLYDVLECHFLLNLCNAPKETIANVKQCLCKLDISEGKDTFAEQCFNTDESLIIMLKQNVNRKNDLLIELSKVQNKL